MVHGSKWVVMELGKDGLGEVEIAQHNYRLPSKKMLELLVESCSTVLNGYKIVKLNLYLSVHGPIIYIPQSFTSSN